MRLSHREAFDLYRAYVDVLCCKRRKDVNAHLRMADPLLVMIKHGTPYKKPEP